MTDEKLLSPRLQILYDYIASDGVDHVDAIGMYLEAIGDLAFEADRCLELKVFNVF
jgi:hypothetical protein